VKVKVDISGLKKFQRIINAGLKQKTGPIRDAIKQWVRRYLGFIRKRYDRLSKSGGGGEWKPLKPETIAKRRKGRGKKRTASILRDTGTLFTAINPAITTPRGALREQVKFGARVGYEQGATHPNSRKATIADIAYYHQKGKGHNPRRRILVDADDKTKRQMVRDMARAVKRAIKASEIPGT
jgi:hypothetical protein